MNVGTLCYVTEQGLGILAHDFYRHGIITHPVIVRRDSLEHKRPQHFEWYPAGTPSCAINRIPASQIVQHWQAAEVRVALFFETPFDWSLVDRCRSAGIKTIIMPMHECMPRVLPAKPDVWLCPSLLDWVWATGNNDIKASSYNTTRYLMKMENYPQLGDGKDGVKSVYLPVPVDTEVIPYRERTIAHTFLHSAGHGGLKGRNGTVEVLEAWKLVRSPLHLLVRTQERGHGRTDCNEAGGTLRVIHGTLSRNVLFSEGDVFLFPEKFNGLSLPLQEACAAGMAVMCGNRFPMNSWLPGECLLPVAHYHKGRIGGGYSEFDEAVFNPKDIAAAMDWWYGRDISHLAQQGQQWRDSHSWEVLGPKILELLEEVVR